MPEVYRLPFNTAQQQFRILCLLNEHDTRQYLRIWSSQIPVRTPFQRWFHIGRLSETLPRDGKDEVHIHSSRDLDDLREIATSGPTGEAVAQADEFWAKLTPHASTNFRSGIHQEPPPSAPGPYEHPGPPPDLHNSTLDTRSTKGAQPPRKWPRLILLLIVGVTVGLVLGKL